MRICVRDYPTFLPERPGPGEAHVWVARLDAPPRSVEELVASLVPEERERGERYRLPAVRDQYLRTRGLLRVLMGSYLGVRPESLALTVTADGKPGLDDGALQFNVSHSQGVAAFVVSEREVGIDLEAIRPVPSADGLVERYFSPVECKRYARFDSRSESGSLFKTESFDASSRRRINSRRTNR